MKIVIALYSIITVFFAIPNLIGDWSKRTRAIIVLSLVIVALLFVMEALYQLNKKRLARLRLKHKSTVEKLNKKITELTKELPAKDDLIERLQKNFDSLATSLKIAKLGAGQAEGEFKYKISRLESERDSLKSQLGDKERELAKTRTPRFKAEIHQVAVGVLKERVDVTAITILASIRNLGMPSIARSWALLARVPEKGLLNGILQHAQQGRLLMFNEGHDPVVHQNEDVLYNKIAEKPLTTGGEVNGAIQFHLEGVTKEDVYRLETVFVLTFEDATERPYFAVRVLRVGEEAPKLIPGMKSVVDPTLKEQDWRRSSQHESNSDSLKAELNKKGIREKLSAFMNEGHALIEKFQENHTVGRLDSDVEAWVNRVEEFLTTLDESYVTRFQHPPLKPYPYESYRNIRKWVDKLYAQSSQLEEFIKEHR